MEAKLAKSIIPFPFDHLPNVSSQKWQLKKRLFHIYTLFSEKKDLLQDVIRPLEKILKQKVSGKLVDIETATASEIANTLPQRVIVSLFRVDPYPKKAFLSFDLGLAQIVTSSVLSNGQATLSNIQVEQLKPITPLNEAVVEYLMVRFLQTVNETLQPARFNLGFEDILQDPKKLLSFYSNTDELAILTIELTIQEQSFFVKLALPLQAVQSLGTQDQNMEFFQYRLQNFLSLQNDFVLEIGGVELTTSELNLLDEGDIILFDESHVTLNDKKEVQGEAVIKPVHGEDGLGYQVEITSHKNQVRAKIKDLL